MAENILDIATYEQIATLLSQLTTNYNAIISNYYNMFYNTTPMDITLSLYTADGELVTYTIPNRAKDFNYVRNGSGNPEGTVQAPVGTIYQDTTNGILYIKEVGTDQNGWNRVGGDVYIESGVGSPEGSLSRARGSMYVDTQGANLYIKTTDYGKTGWLNITAKSIPISYEV